MKKYLILCFLCFFIFIVSCDKKEPTKEEQTPVEYLDDYKLIWNDEYQDSLNSFNDNTIKKAKLFYEGEYVSLDKNITKRKDNKKEFYTNNSLRFVNSPDQYAITIPSNDVSIDYSLSKYRIQFEFLDSVLTVSHEYSNPYGSNFNGWYTYLNEWLNRYVNNPKYLSDNNLEYSRDVIESKTILNGFEVLTYSIYIKDSENIDKPYYDISIIRKENEYINFHLFVMKSKTNQSNRHDEIVKSFKLIDQFGYSSNHVGQYESKPNPKWNEETLNYFNKINDPNTFEFGFFSHSLVDDEDTLNRDLVYQKVTNENERLNYLTDYNQEICATYSHTSWAGIPMYFPKTLANSLAGGNGFNGKPVLQFTLQYTNNNNNVNIYNKDKNYTPMFDILRGEYDDYFNRLALDIKSYKKPVLFRLNNEMNTDWTSYSGIISLLDPDIFQMTWIRLYEIFEKNNVDNCIWIFNPIAVSCPYSSWGEDLCYMPGIDYVQALGITRYEMLNDRQNYVSFKDGYTALYEKNKDYWMNYPWIVSEFGCAAGGAITEKGNITTLYRNKDIQAKWVEEMFNCLNDKENNEFCKKITVMVWFNANDYKDGLIMNSLHLDSSLTDTFAALREGLKKVNE